MITITEAKAKMEFPGKTIGYIMDEQSGRYAVITYGGFLRFVDQVKKNGYKPKFQTGMNDGPETKTFLYTDYFVEVKFIKNNRTRNTISFLTVGKYNVKTEKTVYVKPTKSNCDYWDEMRSTYKPGKLK